MIGIGLDDWPRNEVILNLSWCSKTHKACVFALLPFELFGTRLVLLAKLLVPLSDGCIPIKALLAEPADMFPTNLVEPGLDIPQLLLIDPNPRMFLKIKQAVLIILDVCVEIISE